MLRKYAPGWARKVLAALVSGGVALFSKQILEAWGVLDHPAAVIGTWLRVNIPAPLAYNILGLLIFVALYAGIWWFALRQKTGAPPASLDSAEQERNHGDDLVPLRDAAITIYEQTRDGFSAKLVDRLDRADANDRDEPGESILRHYVNSLVYDEDVSLYGCRPPSKQIVELPKGIEKEGDAIEGGASFQFLSDKKPTYENLHVERRDLEAKIRDVRSMDAGVDLPVSSNKKPNLIPFLEFLDMAVATGWPHSKEDGRWIDFFRLLREAARNGWTEIWGRLAARQLAAIDSQPRERIPTEHWREFEIDPASVLKSGGNDHTRTYALGRSNWGLGERYHDLHIERSVAESWLAHNKCK